MQVKAKIRDSTGTWTEDLTVPNIEQAEEVVTNILKRYNEQEIERYGGAARTRMLVEIIGQAKDVHNWEKRAVIFEGKVEYKCSRCGLIKKYDYALLSRPNTTDKCYPERVCRICNKQYASAINLNRHNSKKHKGIELWQRKNSES